MPSSSHAPYSVPQGEHGGDVQQVARFLRIAPDNILDFSNNSFVQARDITADALASVNSEFDRYPDPDCVALRDALAQHETCPPDELLAGNGSAELIWLALATLQPRHAVLIGPIFSEYRRACEGLGIPHTIVAPPDDCVQWWPQHRPHIPQQADLAVLCSPNNPGGHTCPDLTACINALDCPTILLDLAYRDFLGPGPARENHTWTALKKLPQRLLCLHSLTKFFCSTGIRLGYLAADPALLASMRRKRANWMVNAFAANAGIALLNRFNSYCERLPLLQRDKTTLHAVLDGCGLFTEILSGPSFLIARIDPLRLTAKCSRDRPAATLRTELAVRRILVRDCDTIPGMPSGYLRLQARNTDDSAVLEKALREIAA